jgi:CBS domain-containing protein
MGTLIAILQKRSPVLHVLEPDDTVTSAARVMAEYSVGSVVIVYAGRLVGIFTERDLLRRVVARGHAPEQTLLKDVMTPAPVVAQISESRASAIAKMQALGCRHLPVVIGSEVIDVLSIRDLLYWELDERTSEVDSLRRYIEGSY